MPLKQLPLAKDQKSDWFRVDSRRLVFEEGYNERENFGDIEALANSIRAAGVRTPLLCHRRGEEYVVKRGHRRTLALRIVEKEGEIIMVPVILAPRGYNAEEAVLDLLVENDALPFTPWEQAKVLRRLRNLGWSESDMAERSGKSKVYVKKLLSLADAPQKLINLVREGHITATHATDAIAKDMIEEVIVAVEKKQKAAGGASAELFASEKQTKVTKTKPSDVRPNSWKIFKKVAPSIQRETLPPEKASIYDLLTKILQGEYTEQELREFFA